MRARALTPGSGLHRGLCGKAGVIGRGSGLPPGTGSRSGRVHSPSTGGLPKRLSGPARGDTKQRRVSWNLPLPAWVYTEVYTTLPS